MAWKTGLRNTRLAFHFLHSQKIRITYTTRSNRNRRRWCTDRHDLYWLQKPSIRDKAAEIDKIRDNSIFKLNEILSELKLPLLKIPTEIKTCVEAFGANEHA